MNSRALAGAAAIAVVAVAVVVAIVESWSPEAWAALAAWITAGVAVAAGYVALGQLGEARASRLEQARLRKEQAQPYVVAFIDFSEASTFLVDLVVRNFGATAAHDVRLDIEPIPRRSIDQERQSESPADEQLNADNQTNVNEEPSANGEHDEYVWLPERIPVLVPGQEWRTLWDSGRRMDSDLPDHHAAKITFGDSQGESYCVECDLDWRVVKDREMVQVYGAHHAAKALEEMNKNIAKWKEGPTGGLAVFVRDGDAKDERQRQKRDARLGEQRSRQSPAEAPRPSQ
jgi:hypothetical protein